MVDAYAPKVFSWSLGVQHEILKNTSVEVRYLALAHRFAHPASVEFDYRLRTTALCRCRRTSVHRTSLPPLSATHPHWRSSTRKRSVGALEEIWPEGFTGGVITAEAPGASSTYHGALSNSFTASPRSPAPRELHPREDAGQRYKRPEHQYVNPRRAQDSYDITMNGRAPRWTFATKSR